jgi:hypothetical protein
MSGVGWGAPFGITFWQGFPLPVIGGKTEHRRDEVFVTETRQARRWRSTLKIRLMAWLALGHTLRRREASGSLLRKVTTGLTPTIQPAGTPRARAVL